VLKAGEEQYAIWNKGMKAKYEKRMKEKEVMEDL